jgi:DNA polymerase V
VNAVVALVDCNSFYASCERTFNPALWNRPVAVLSNNDGCVVARTDEVKALGIALGTPYFKCADAMKKNNVAVFSSNYTLYGDMSQRVMEVLSRFSPEIEVYSIDEAFLSLSGLGSQNLNQYAGTIRWTVETWTGIPVSVGLAATKTLAKVANRIAKKNKRLGGIQSLVGLSPSEIDEILDAVPVESVWGIGGQTEKKLKERGVFTARQYKHADPKWIRKQFNIVGLRTQEELWGKPRLSLDDAPAPKQQIICSRSFGRPVTALDELEESVSDYASQAAVKLRAQKSVVKVLQVYIATNPFKGGPQYCNAVQVVFPSATADTFELVRFARRSVGKIFKPGYEYKKAGVVLTGLTPDDGNQTDLFWNSDGPRRQKLMECLDGINQKHGMGAIQVASAGIAKPWKMLREFESPHYTTRLSDLPIVRTV